MNRIVARAKDTYQVLPPTARNAAASAFGWYLRWWRYGRNTEGLVEQARLRETWSDVQWYRYQQSVLAVLLERAATRVPHYREHWRSRRGNGDTASWGDLANWPVLNKEELRRDPHAFVADDARPERMFRLSTSGTSGSPITTWRSRRTSQAWYALFEARTRLWYGVNRHMPWAILGGQLVTPASQTRPPFWAWNSGLRQLYMSTLHLSTSNAGAYLDAMRRYRVRHMYGYASSMYWLAAMARESGSVAPQLAVAVSNAEPLHRHQRHLISEVFGCPVRDTYGMSEIVAGGTECEHGAIHTWPDAGIIEVMDDVFDRLLPPGASGRFVCTGLLNEDMPLIRYDVGDRGAIGATSGEACACGRLLPRFERIEGRTSDNLVTSDGRRVFWVNPVFYELPVREAQVVQESLARLRVNVVPGAGYDESVSQMIKQRLRQRVGEVEVVVARVEAIPRGPNGKFRAVINLVEQGD